MLGVFARSLDSVECSASPHRNLYMHCNWHGHVTEEDCLNSVISTPEKRNTNHQKMNSSAHCTRDTSHPPRGHRQTQTQEAFSLSSTISGFASTTKNARFSIQSAGVSPSSRSSKFQQIRARMTRASASTTLVRRTLAKARRGGAKGDNTHLYPMQCRVPIEKGRNASLLSPANRAS